MNYEYNKKYFVDDAKAGAVGCLAVIGVIVALGGFFWGWMFGCGGAAIIVLAIVIGVLCIKTPTDEEMDKEAVSLFSTLDTLAFKKLGIDSSEVSLAEPVKFWGYRFVSPSILGDEANNAMPWKQGDDKKYRSSEITLTGFYFGENSVYCYERTASLVSDAIKETTEEYYYKDIVSVKTDSTDIPQVDSEGKEIAGSRIRSEEFILTNMGGERKCCPVDDVSKAEAAVIAFRALLKQKKL